ncbi:uncharacterized protein LOC129301718 [Prosopis cineraria]|uniref:uncharacterized protein LOC129301718 n=1 Tax=Prosopis cineraria TaxID=364024 RepID=UPI00240FBE68|nr:uncharacterized protein LOC129301718 [Prosopis cineraria]
MTSPSSCSSSSSISICPEKLVKRELSNMSIEAYHVGKAASVPFEWESEPGTPKFKLSRDASDLPPLTPPPSYLYNKTSKSKKSMPMKSSSSFKPSLLQTIFVNRATRKQSPNIPSSSSSSTSSSSSFSSPAYFSVPSSPMIYSQKNEEEELYDADVRNSARWGRGCYFMIKKVLPRDFQ